MDRLDDTASRQENTPNSRPGAPHVGALGNRGGPDAKEAGPEPTAAGNNGTQLDHVTGTRPAQPRNPSHANQNRDGKTRPALLPPYERWKGRRQRARGESWGKAPATRQDKARKAGTAWCSFCRSSTQVAL